MTEDTKLPEFDFSSASEPLIELLIEDPPELEILREILTSNSGRPEILKLLLQADNVPEDIKSGAEKILNLPIKREETSVHMGKAIPSEDERKQRLLQKIRSLTVGEKIALALKGGKEIRSILCKDSNKEVILSVIKNPKVTDSEAELIAHSRNIPEEALRLISKNREWMRNYNVVLALINNPKTPAGIGAGLVSTLKTKDLATLEKNRNVSETVRIMAKKLYAARKKI